MNSKTAGMWIKLRARSLGSEVSLYVAQAFLSPLEPSLVLLSRLSLFIVRGLGCLPPLWV